jgi:GrpB-like predicted nucleotidyltransferase (UPF0157 family)
MNNLRDLTSLKEKYRFEEYDPRYTNLYDAERDRILRELGQINLNLHHFGSTAIKNIGGKGVIDIFIECSKSDIKSVSGILTSKLGYEFRESGGNKDRLFHQIEINKRRYHVHLTDFGNEEITKCLAFRDFLNSNSELAKEYSEIKKLASEKALEMDNKDDMKQIYTDTKKPVIDKIMRLLSA